MFDTADIYGDGRIESLIGEVVSSSSVIIVSKAGYLSERGENQDFSPTHLRRALECSLDRLRRRELDVFLLHSPPPSVLDQGAAAAQLDELRAKGLIKKTGVSLRTVADFDRALAWPGCQVVELIFNLLDQRALDLGLLDRARATGVQVIARLPLCSGLLTGKYEVGAVFDQRDRRHQWPRHQLDAWIQAANSFRFLVREGRSLAQAALAFCLATPGITYVIPGMKHPEQVRHNAAAAGSTCRLSEQEFQAAREEWQTLRHLPPQLPHRPRRTKEGLAVVHERSSA